MIHENLTPKEALERAQLLMRYDNRKTLSENYKSLKEQTSCPNSITYEELMEIVETIEGEIDDLQNWTATADLTDWEEEQKIIYDEIKKCEGKNVYDEENEKCVSAIDMLKTEYKSLNKQDWVGGYATLEEDLQEIIDDDYSSKGTRYAKLAMKILKKETTTPTPTPTPTQTESERQRNINNVWCATDKDGIIIVANSVINGMKWSEYIKKYNVTASEIDVAKAFCPNKSEGGDRDRDRDRDKEKKKKTTFNWKTDCAPNYVKGCKSDKIKEIQKCLGLVVDGKFGPKTQNKLAQKGFPNGFTDSDIPKICGTSTTTKPEEKPDVGYDDTNQNF